MIVLELLGKEYQGNMYMRVQAVVPDCSMNQIREQVKQEDVTVKAKSSHHSQTDAAKGFGGKYGVQKGKQDKVS